jgi:tetratricopeptide (TPR) repeat protein
VDVASETARAYRAFATGRYAEAAGIARLVLAIAPDDPAALTLIGRLALTAGQPDVAYATINRVLELHPQMAALWLDRAQALRDLGLHREAADAAERAIVLDSRNASAWVNLGEIRLSMNERTGAGEAFRQALGIEPASVAALRGICLADDVSPDSALVRQMAALTREATLKPGDLARIHYSLAQVHRRAGQREKFIQALFAANATQRAICPDGRARYQAIFDRLESALTKDVFAKLERAEPVEPSPIFILGMPRSGTTLVERLLAAHPDVAAGGELDYMRRPLRREVERLTARPFPHGFESISPADRNSMARAYADRLRFTGRGVPRVTDKTPGNFHVLGMLRVLFPRGCIIHVARDPMDTCFSILQYPFNDQSPHTCDVELLAYAYARYLRLMKRWLEICGDEFMTVEYERLVESPAAEARRLFEHCGLEWSDSYLEFHRIGGGFRTFSATQVRRPIYTSSVGAWREFADELAPLRRALDIELRQTEFMLRSTDE